MSNMDIAIELQTLLNEVKQLRQKKLTGKQDTALKQVRFAIEKAQGLFV